MNDKINNRNVPINYFYNQSNCKCHHNSYQTLLLNHIHSWFLPRNLCRMKHHQLLIGHSSFSLSSIDFSDLAIPSIAVKSSVLSDQ